jgi:hypothetical protein
MTHVQGYGPKAVAAQTVNLGLLPQLRPGVFGQITWHIACDGAVCRSGVVCQSVGTPQSVPQLLA